MPATPRLLKIGLVASFEGAGSRTGYEALSAARLALGDVNRAPTARLELVALDSGHRAGGVAARLADLAGDADVVAIISLAPPAPSEARQPPSTRQASLVQPIAIGVYPTGSNRSDGWLLAGPSMAQVVESAARAAQRLGVRRLGVVGMAVSPAIVADLPLTVASLDWPIDGAGAAARSPIAAVQPDGILLVGNTSDLVRIADLLARQGYRGPVFVYTFDQADDWTVIFPLMLATSVYWIHGELASFQPDRLVGWGQVPNASELTPLGRWTYTIVRAVAEAAQRQARPTRQTVATALADWRPPAMAVTVDRVLPGGQLGERIVAVDR